MFVEPGGRAFARRLTARDLVTLHRLSDPAVSLDGKTVAFVERSVHFDQNKASYAIRLPLLIGHTVPTTLLGADKGVAQPAWSVDGRAVLAISERSGSAQVGRFPIAGGAPVRVTDLPGDVGSFLQTNDGRRLVVSSMVRPGQQADGPGMALGAAPSLVAASHMTGRVYDRLFVRHWDQWDDGQRSHLFSIAIGADGVASGRPVDLMRGIDGDTLSKPFGDKADYVASPDGRSVFFSVRIAGRTEP